jgi:hypothetical protein
MAKKRAAKRTRVAKSKRISLATHLRRIEKTARRNMVAGKESGACLVTDPQTGRTRCMRTDPDTCKALRGTFVGGPCGPR